MHPQIIQYDVNQGDRRGEIPIKVLQKCDEFFLPFALIGQPPNIVLGLWIAFFLIELGVGIWSHSLSLLAGAGHPYNGLGHAEELPSNSTY